MKYGHAKKKGTWEIGYEWRHMEKDVMWHQLTHSDFAAFGARDITGSSGKSYYNGTNVEGGILNAKYKLYDNAALGFKWYMTDAIESATSGTRETTHRIQFDLIFKF